jgi:hypothetical protein
MRSVGLYIWLAITAFLMIGASYLKSQMLKHRAPGTAILSPFWWGRGFTILTSPTSFTGEGQFYRSWTVRLELACMLWMFGGLIFFIFAPAKERSKAALVDGLGAPEISTALTIEESRPWPHQK